MKSRNRTGNELLSNQEGIANKTAPEPSTSAKGDWQEIVLGEFKVEIKDMARLDRQDRDRRDVGH